MTFNQLYRRAKVKNDRFFVLVCSLCFGFAPDGFGFGFSSLDSPCCLFVVSHFVTGVLDFGLWTFSFTCLSVLCCDPFFDLHITILC